MWVLQQLSSTSSQSSLENSWKFYKCQDFRSPLSLKIRRFTSTWFCIISDDNSPALAFRVCPLDRKKKPVEVVTRCHKASSFGNISFMTVSWKVKIHWPLGSKFCPFPALAGCNTAKDPSPEGFQVSPWEKEELFDHEKWILYFGYYICLSITVVWQQCDHSCNTRASSFCSPENVGEQGYVVDHGFWWSDGTTSLLKKCVNPVQRSEATKNKNTKQDHHKINELDHTRWPPTLLHREPTFNCTPTQLDPYIQPISRRRISWVGICRNAIDKKIDFHVKS